MIVIPMAGMSSRFFAEGYSLPKYMLDIEGKTLFDYSVESFAKYFSSELFLFVIRDVHGTKKFVEERIAELNIKHFAIVTICKETRGQAETVSLGLNEYGDYKGAITIFNIDTFRPDFTLPTKHEIGDGYLEVFKGDGANWSYVRPKQNNGTEIDLVREKEQISELCCTGVYHFSNVEDFLTAFNHYISMPKELWEKGELYVAPLYNHLISLGKKINYHLIERDDVIFCGTPDEYLALKKSKC